MITELLENLKQKIYGFKANVSQYNITLYRIMLPIILLRFYTFKNVKNMSS